MNKILIRIQKSFLQQADWDLQELWKKFMKNHVFNMLKFNQKMSCWENKKSQHLKYLTFNIQKCWMSWKLWKHEKFTAEKKDLFKTLFLTSRKWHVSTQSGSKSETFTKKSTKKFNSEKFLFNMSTESSNMIIMNFFQQE